jgi:hypothetical protein
LGYSLRRLHPITYELALSLVIYALSRHFIFIITLFISIMVFTYGVFGYGAMVRSPSIPH